MADALTGNDNGKVLVIGASGYVGSRLVNVLVGKGYRVRAAGRSMAKLQARSWARDPRIELCELDMQDSESLERALCGCSYVYYLVHSMNPANRDFRSADRASAENMVAAGEKAAIRQLIYLGGLGESSDNLSAHLRSRAEVAEILLKASFPTTVLRAAMIIGSGSASFEILRYLVDRLPFMVTPRWVETPSQPVAIRNVLVYLAGCLGREESFRQVFDLGGPAVLSYRRLMEIYAEEAGLPHPVILPVPVFTPRLSSYWINFITPVPAYIARPLAEGLRNPAVALDSRIKQLIPQELLSCREAIRLALDRTQHHRVESHWTDSGMLRPVEWFNSSDPSWAGGAVVTDVRRLVIEGSAAEAWSAIARIGGTTGWYYANWLWQLRGLVDWLAGGVGLRRGRRHPEELRVGDAVDCWRVREVDPGRRLTLIAEMKLPGEAALMFEVLPAGPGRTEIVQTARFLPFGLAGLAYWLLVAPLHEFVFTGMLRGVAKASGCRTVGCARSPSPDQTLDPVHRPNKDAALRPEFPGAL